MRSENEQTDAVSSKRDPYDAAVLQFLDQEVKASAGKMADPRAPADDVDALVDDLLKETVHATDTPAADQDTGSEELDLLFSRIFKESKVEIHAEADQAQLFGDAGVDPNVQEISPAGTKAADLCHAGIVPGPELAAASVQAAAPLAAAKVVPATLPVPSPTILQTGEAGEMKGSEEAAPENVQPEKVQVFHMTPSGPAWNWRIAAIAAAFLCLVAGIGLVSTTGSKNGVPDPPSQPSGPATQTFAPNRVTPEVQSPASNPAAETAIAVPRTARSVNPARPVEAARAENAGSAAAPRGDGNLATEAQPPPMSAPDPALSATVMADPVEKPAAAATPPAESPIVAAPPRATETTPPLPVPEPAANTVNPKSAARLEDPAAMNRPAFQPPLPTLAAPKRATPAVVISKVLPAYPEMARKARITGTVVVDILIDERGKVTQATPVSGPAMLQAEAVSAVLRWQFRPANVEGVPVSSSNQVAIIFK